MKKALKITMGTALAVSALTPVAAFAAEDVTTATKAKDGFYNIETGAFYTASEFKALTKAEQKAVIKDTNFYLVFNGTVYSGLDIALKTTEELDAAGLAEEAFEAEKEVELTEDGKVLDKDGNVIGDGDNEVPELAVESVSAINPTTIQVTFNGDLTDENLAVSNFNLSKGTVEAVTAQGNVATISVAGLTFGDAVTVTVGNPAHTATVTVPEVSEVYALEITTDAPSDTIKSDGAAKTQITVTLKDRATGEVVDKDGIIQFSATRGGLGQTTSALQDGKATVQLTSVASATSVLSTITAVVSDVPGAAEFEGLSAQKTVTFSPDAVDEGQVNFVTAVSAESTQGDRLFVTFSDKITAAAYKEEIKKSVAPRAVTSIDYAINVDGKRVAVSDVVNKTANTLEFILDTDVVGNATPADYQRIEQTVAWTGTPAAVGQKNYLRDNVTHNVSFPGNVGSLVLQNSTGINFILTDTSKPGVLGVTAKDQLEFSVRFTESMDETTIERLVANTNNPTGPIKNPNFLLDGREVLVIPQTATTPSQVQINQAKAANQVILTSLQVGNYSIKDGKATDTRNVVTFKVHKDFALAGGVHQIQIANVGDWAQDVDPAQNRVATDTFDFTVAVDATKPKASIVVQSPEQWLVTFDKAVSTVTGKTAEDVFKIKTANEDDTLTFGTDFDVYEIEEDGVFGTKLNANSQISAESNFLIEFKQDWTEKYTTSANPSKTYFASTQNPYVVTLEHLESLVGNKIDKAELNVKLSYDGKSPEIASVVDVYEVDGKRYGFNNTKVLSPAVEGEGRFIHVKMDEPIKMNNVGTESEEGLTPSEEQAAKGGVPVPTYEFVKGDKVVQAEVVADTLATDDQSFVLRPVNGQELEAGTWTLYIRSISDDIGNTSATISKQITITAKESAVTKTQIAWAAFDDAAGEGKLLNNPAENNDVVYVKFTKEMKADGANGVSRTQNYVFAGQPLPEGSQVIKGITGVTNAWDGVTILMPSGTWDGTNSHDFTNTLNIASNFVAADGEALSGAYEVELTDLSPAASDLDNELEAIYTQANAGVLSVTVGTNPAVTTRAAVLDATASETTTVDGKIDTITVTTDKAIALSLTGITRNEIRVNGKVFVATQTGGTSHTFTAKTTADEIDGTATNNLKVTGTDGAIIVNTGSVIDAAAPVITKAQLNSDKNKIAVTFSEAVTGANDYLTDGFTALVDTDFGSSITGGATIASVEHNAATPNQAVLTLNQAAPGALSTDTINAVANSIYDFASTTVDVNAMTTATVEIKGGTDAAAALQAAIAAVNNADAAGISAAVTALAALVADTTVLDPADFVAANAAAYVAELATNPATSAAEVQAAIDAVNLAGAVAQAKADLNAKIGDATAANVATEGVAVGDNIVGSGATLTAAIAVAQGVHDDATSTAQQLIDASTTLNDALTAYNDAVVEALSGLNNVSVEEQADNSTNTVTLGAGETLVLTSSDSAFATATEDPAGTVKVTGVAEGTATITVEVKNAAGNVIKTGTIDVTVTL